MSHLGHRNPQALFSGFKRTCNYVTLNKVSAKTDVKKVFFESRAITP